MSNADCRDDTLEPEPIGVRCTDHHRLYPCQLCAIFTNELRPDQVERLALLIEEMGEAAHVCGKVLRHGYASTDPTKHDNVTNKEMLEHELGDVLYAITLLSKTDLQESKIVDQRERKARTVLNYLHHQALTP